MAVGIAALAPLVIGHVADSEVWGPHLFFCAGFVLVALGREEPRPLLLGALLGVAVSHHLSAVLLVPLAIGSAWPRTPLRETGPGPVVRNGLLGLLGSAIGLVPYVTLAIGQGGAWRWGDTRTPSGLLPHVTRGDYGVVALSLHTEDVGTWDVVARCWASLADALTVGALPHALVFVALMVALVAFTPRPAQVAPAAWIGLWASLATTTAIFPALQNIDPASPFGAWILERFDLLPLCLWTIPLGLALDRLGDLDLRPPLRLALVGAGALLVISQLLRALAGGLPRDERGVERYAVDLLRTPIVLDSSHPPLVFGTDDHRTFPALYAAEVLHEGPGLYVDASLLTFPWYRQRLRERFPELPEQDKPLRLMGAIWADPALRDTPIYVTHPFSRPAARELLLVPEGMLWRVIPPGADPDLFAADAAVERHLAALARYDSRAEDFAGRVHPDRHPWSVDLWFAYVDRSVAMVNMLRARGDAHDATRVEQAFEEAFGVPLADPG